VFSNDTVVLGRSNDTVVIGAGIKDASNAKLQVTGYIKATSPELADNSTLVATTAFVKAALAANGSFVPTNYLGYNTPTVQQPRVGVGYETGLVADVTDTLNHLFMYAGSGKAAIVAATITPEGDTAILDLTTAAAFRVTLNAHVTHITFTNASGRAGSMRYITIVLRQGTGVNLVEWPSNIRWSYNQEPVLAYEKDYEDVVTLVKFGTDGYWYGFFIGSGFHV
jgi:hypothetical protein